MIIVHLVPYFNPHYKYQEYYLARENGRAGNKVYIITGLNCNSGSQKIIDYEYFEVIYLPIIFKLANRVILKSLYSKIKEISPDILVVHTIFSFLTIQLLFRKKAAKKYIFDDHMTIDQVNTSLIGRFSYFLFRQFCRNRLLKIADKIIVVSESCIGTLTIHLGIPYNRIKVIPLAADPNHFYFNLSKRKTIRENLNIHEESIVVGFTGKIYKERKLDIFLNALANIETQKNVFLLVIGKIDDNYEHDFLRLFNSVTFNKRILSMRSYDELPHYLSVFDILVYTLPTISTLEASACSRVIICPDFLKERFSYNNGYGYDFNSNNSLNLSTLLTTLIENDNLRNTMGANGRELILNELNWEIVSEKFLEL